LSRCLQLAQNNPPALSSGRMGECYARPFAHPPAGSVNESRANPGESGESARRFPENGTVLYRRRTSSLVAPLNHFSLSETLNGTEGPAFERGLIGNGRAALRFRSSENRGRAMLTVK
jgi:hypothetical protein